MNGQPRRPLIALPVSDTARVITLAIDSSRQLVIVTRGRVVLQAWILDSERRLQAAREGDFIPVWCDNREGDKAA